MTTETSTPGLPDGFVAALEHVLGPESVCTRRREVLAYAYDATGEKRPPDVVVIPQSTEGVTAAVRLARHYGVPLVPRGAGTNLSGGTVPVRGGMVLSTSRMNRILRIDAESHLAIVQPGVTNQALQDALRPLGFFYAPDPSSGKVSTIGGNIAENAGGPRCFKYGVTTNHVLGLEVVLSDGSVLELGGMVGDERGLDLTGVFVGSEGTMGIVTRAILHILPTPEAVKTMLVIYDDLDLCAGTVSQIVAQKIIPATLELMDREQIRLLREAGFPGFPDDAQAVLLIEVDGPAPEIGKQLQRLMTICQAGGARTVKVATGERERQELWRARKAGFGVLARMSPFVWVQDVTVPRNQLAPMLRKVREISERYALPLVSVAHAGDGNIHPAVPYNPRDPAECARVRAADKEILTACVALGGSITGEHGVGLDKLENVSLMLGPEQLQLMQQVQQAFDPLGLMNPGKAIPSRLGGF